jgi:alkylation response protein AidB-like acyl-CoA dehydrogenase
MDFELTQEHMIFRDAIRDFAEKEIAPLVEEAEETETFPVELFPKMGDLGFLCVCYPEEYGGPGADKITECIYVEELCRVSAGITSAFLVQGGLGTYPILQYGTEEQKQRYLVPAIKGRKISAFGLTEPNAGSDAASIRTRAVRDGDHYLINGSKTFITNAPICDFVLVAAYTDPTRRGEGVNLFIVEDGTEGFRKGKKLKKVGNRSSETGELFFEDCRVHRSQMIGEREGGGFAQLEDTLRSGRITYGARCSGLAQAIFEASLQYSRERVQFGKPIGRFQVNRFRLAEMAMYIDIMRTITYRAAWLHDQGRPCMKEASMVKLFCSEALQQIASWGMQLFGGYGYMMEYPMQRYWRDARLFTITEGTSEIQHMIIAREMGF